MSCSMSEKVHLYHDGELDAAERQVVERHLESCADCRAEIEQLSAISESFRSSPAPKLSQFSVHRLHAMADRWMEDDLVRVARVLRAVAACILVAGSAWLIGTTPAASQAPEAAAAPWVEVAAVTNAEVASIDTTTPAASWYLADASARAEENP
jgi:anti-sigma factor RsiW